MKVLFIGDVVGKPGRQAIAALVPKLRGEHEIDLVIANGENSAHGAGLTASTVTALLESGIEVITSGDHVWDQKEIYQVIDREHRLLRPLNMSPTSPGRGSVIVHVNEKTAFAVVNLIGRVFMPHADCPFRAADTEIARLRQQTNLILVDLHAEATSEKIAMGRFLDGKVSVVVGTHTHVPTADDQILPKGTAYITDVGMCGPYDSVLGRDVDAVLYRFLTQMPRRMEVATDKVMLSAVVIDINEQTGQSRSIQRILAKL